MSTPVASAKALDEALAVAFSLLRLLHHVDNAGDGVIGKGLGGAHFQRPLAVDATSVDRIARLLFHGDAFAGDRGLVDAGGANPHDAVGSYRLARLDQEEVAGPDLLDGNLDLTILTPDPRRLWCQIHQRMDRGAGLFLGVPFGRFRDRVQKDQHRPFGRLAHQRRHDRCNAHQQLDADLAFKDQLFNGLAPKKETSGEDGQRINGSRGEAPYSPPGQPDKPAGEQEQTGGQRGQHLGVAPGKWRPGHLQAFLGWKAQLGEPALEFFHARDGWVKCQPHLGRPGIDL
jgi:hypothetical protein